MKKFTFLIIVILAAYNFSRAQILPELDKIKEIKLLESNRDDVRRILSQYIQVSDEEHQDTYTSMNSEVEVNYSKGACNEDSERGSLNTTEWKVISMTIELKTSVKLKDIKLGLTKYRKERIYRNDSELFVYYNKDLGIILKVRKDKVEEIFFNPPMKYYPLLCDKEYTGMISSTKSIFTNKLKDRIHFIDSAEELRSLKLSRLKITSNCNRNGTQVVQPIKVSTKVRYASPAYGLTFNYGVSGGKIIGRGANVLWDLSDVKPGSYTITAAVDDGCGFCGKSMTKTVVVKDCSN